MSALLARESSGFDRPSKKGGAMRRTELLEEVRKVRLEELYAG